MVSRAYLVLSLLSIGLFACKQDAEGGDAKGGDAKSDGAKGDAEGDAEKGDSKQTDTKTGADGGTTPASSAAGDAVVPADAIKDCPESLQGKDEVSRVITKACGTVPVTGTYKMEGGTLFLEPGAKLAFADGAVMQVGYSAPSKLVIRGTQAEPVTLTASGDKVPGVWKGVEIHGKGARSSIQHAVIEWAGKGDQALLVAAEDVTVEGLTVRGAKELAVKVDAQGSLAKFDGNTFEEVASHQIVRIPPARAGAIGRANKWPADGVVQVVAGHVDRDVTWADIGAPWHVTGKIKVHGEAGNRVSLEIEAGNELGFDGDAKVEVGYSGEGTLVVAGTKDAPVVLRSDERQEPGAWRGLEIHGKGEAEITGAVFRHAGKDGDRGALYADGEAQVSMSESTFEECAVGVVIKHKKVDIRKFEKNTFEGTPKAAILGAPHFGKLAGDNTYEGESTIQIERGTLEEDATWALQPGARVELGGRLQVAGGRLVVAAGTTLHVADGTQIDVGQGHTGGLELVGTAEAPITLLGQRDDAGAWTGIVFYGQAHGNKLEHVELRNAGGKAAVEFHNESDGTIEGLSCDKCSAPALTWSCKAKVEHSDVTAGEGTPAPVEAPACR